MADSAARATFRTTVALAPSESVTRSPTDLVPALEKARVTVCPVASSNSPSLSKSHRWEELGIGPSASDEVDENVICSLTAGVDGS